MKLLYFYYYVPALIRPSMASVIYFIPTTLQTMGVGKNYYKLGNSKLRGASGSEQVTVK